MPKIIKRIPKTAEQSAKLSGLSRNQITVGADPEFELLDKRSGQSINAHGIVSGGLSGQIGLDGAGSQVEFRPLPSHSTRKLATNFFRLLRRFRNRYARHNYSLSIRGNRFSLGGHIHFGLKDESNVNLSDSQLRTIVEVLDDFLGKPLRRLSGSARQGSGYNELGAWRRQNWGFEYRVPPANMWRCRELAEIVLKIAKRLFWQCLVKDTVMYDSALGLKEYTKVAGLTASEYCSWTRLLAEDASDHGCKDLVALWNLDTTPTSPSAPLAPESHVAQVQFSDQWEMRPRQDIQNLVSTIVFRRAITFRFFGLRADRGFVTTFFNQHMASITDCPVSAWHDHSDLVSIGIPYTFRTATCTDSERAKMLAALAQGFNMESRS